MENNFPIMSPYRILLFAAITLLLLIVLLVGLNWGDEPPPDDRDLQLDLRLIPSADDGYPILIKAIEAFQEVSDSSRLQNLSHDGSDDEWLREELLRNEEALDLIAQAAQHPAILLPKLGPTDLREGLAQVRTMSRLILSRASLRLREPGNEEEALNDFLLVMQLGQRLTDGGVTLIDLLVGIATQGMALHGVREEAAGLSLTAEECRQLLAAMDEHRITRHMLVEILKGEYTYASETLEFLLSAGSTFDWSKFFRYAVKPNKTMRLIGDEYRMMIELVQEPVYNQTSWPTEERSFDGSLPLENALGRTLAEFTAVSLAKPMLSAFLHEANFGNIQLMVALLSFEAAEGRLPESLDELVPEWIHAIPADPFSGNAPGYSKEHRLLFTAGPEAVTDPAEVATSGREARGILLPEPVQPDQ